MRTLGIRAWHTLLVHETDHQVRSRREIALNLWCNSTFGMLLHVNHSNRAQMGRGTGNRRMLETLVTLDVRKLEPWQLDEAQQIWRDFSERKFLSFHQCAVDPARIELDERIVSDLLGLGEDAVAAVARLRTLLASEPSIHGSKKPEIALRGDREGQYSNPESTKRPVARLFCLDGPGRNGDRSHRLPLGGRP